MGRNNSEEGEIKIISNKLSFLIRLLLKQNSQLSKLSAKETISMIKDMGFSSEDISAMSGIPIKTVRNVLPQINRENEKPKP